MVVTVLAVAVVYNVRHSQDGTVITDVITWVDGARVNVIDVGTVRLN